MGGYGKMIESLIEASADGSVSTEILREMEQKQLASSESSVESRKLLTIVTLFCGWFSRK